MGSVLVGADIWAVKKLHFRPLGSLDKFNILAASRAFWAVQCGLGKLAMWS